MNSSQASVEGRSVISYFCLSDFHFLWVAGCGFSQDQEGLWLYARKSYSYVHNSRRGILDLSCLFLILRSRVTIIIGKQSLIFFSFTVS
jgi:hypothetical protein